MQSVIAKQEQTGPRRCLKGERKKGKIFLKYTRNFSCEFGYKRGTKTFGSIAKVNFEELFFKGRLC